MKTAPDRTVLLGLLSRHECSHRGHCIGARGREQAGAAAPVATAVSLACLTLAGQAGDARIGQTRSGLIEDALIVAAGVAIVAMAVKPRSR